MNWNWKEFAMSPGIIIAIVVIILGILVALQVMALTPVLAGCLFAALGVARLT